MQLTGEESHLVGQDEKLASEMSSDFSKLAKWEEDLQESISVSSLPRPFFLGGGLSGETDALETSLTGLLKYSLSLTSRSDLLKLSVLRTI